MGISRNLGQSHRSAVFSWWLAGGLSGAFSAHLKTRRSSSSRKPSHHGRTRNTTMSIVAHFALSWTMSIVVHHGRKCNTTLHFALHGRQNATQHISIVVHHMDENATQHCPPWSIFALDL